MIKTDNSTENMIRLRELSNTLARQISERNKKLSVNHERNLVFIDIWSGFLNELPVMICLTEMDYYFKHVNKKFCEVMGYSEEELTASSYLHLLHPDDINQSMEEREIVIGKQATKGFTNRLLKKDGTYVKLRWLVYMYEESMVIAYAEIIE